jgi:hypothetical protein
VSGPAREYKKYLGEKPDLQDTLYMYFGRNFIAEAAQKAHA